MVVLCSIFKRMDIFKLCIAKKLRAKLCSAK